MGPTNTALHALHVADQTLREAQSRLDAATRGRRVQQRRVETLDAKLAEERQASMKARGEVDRLNLDLASRADHIERLRGHQQNTSNNKEYQGYLTEINNLKEERAGVEEQAMAAMQQADDAAAALAETGGQLGTERAKLDELEGAGAERVRLLEAEVEAARPARDAAAAQVPEAPRQLFERLAERYDGEAMAPLEMPDARKTEYFCGSCYRELVMDTYNKLATADRPVQCPSCDRLLFIPPSLTPEQAVPKTAKAKRAPSKKKSAKSDPAAAARKAVTTLKPMLTTASAESLREAEVSDQPTVTCEVTVDARAAGEFEAISAEDLEQRVRAKMQAQDVEVKLIVTSRTPEAQPAE